MATDAVTNFLEDSVGHFTRPTDAGDIAAEVAARIAGDAANAAAVVIEAAGRTAGDTTNATAAAAAQATASAAYVKPGPGIPSTDMTPAVATSLSKADNAVSKDTLVFNVLDYGAVGNGVADDTTAIQAAIAAAAVNDGIVYFPTANGTGSYNITAALTVPNFVALVGGARSFYSAGSAKAKISMANGIDSPAIKNADQVNGNSGITIRDLFVVGGSVGTSHAIDMRGLGSNETHGVLIENCTVSRAGGSTIFFSLVQESVVRNNYLLNATGPGLHLSNVSDTTVEGNQITTKATSGAHGIALVNGTGNCIIRGNYVFLCDFGIQLSTAPRNIILGNRINTNVKDGINCLNPNSTGTIIVGNVLYDNGTGLTGTRGGITLDGSTSGIVVTGNMCTDTRIGGAKTQSSGIRIASTATQNLVYGNNCFGNAATPGLLSTSTGQNQVYGNQIDASTNEFIQTALTQTRTAQTLAADGAVTINAALGNSVDIALQASATSSSITNPTAGQVLRITWIQDVTGGRTYVWPSNCKFAGGSAPSDTTAGKRSTVTLVYDGINWNEQGRAVIVG